MGKIYLKVYPHIEFQDEDLIFYRERNIFNFNVHAQKITLDNLLNMKKMDLNIFENFVLSKGYEYVNFSEEYGNKSYHFAVDDFQGKATRHLTYIKFSSSNKTSISYQTSIQSEYVSFKNSLSLKGFKLTESGNFEGSIYIVYSKLNTKVSLYSFRGPNSNGRIITGYEVNIE